VESTADLLAVHTAAAEPEASMAAVAEVSTEAVAVSTAVVVVTDNETRPELRARLLRLPGFSIA
jgi:hypothetical protein